MHRRPRPTPPLLVTVVALLLPLASPLALPLSAPSGPPAAPVPASPATPRTVEVASPPALRPTSGPPPRLGPVVDHRPGARHAPDPPPPLAATAGPATAVAARTGWRPPLPGRVTVVRAFAPGPQRWSPGHRGVDLSAPAGSAVSAAGPGRVVFAGQVAGRGVVSVAHGDLRTTYEPVVPAVRAGDVVAGGSVLGVLDAGHAGCGGCLHWGLRRGDHYLDPMRLLRPARVRLLPLSGPDP